MTQPFNLKGKSEVEISNRLRAELEEILKRKEVGSTLQELAQEFKEAGRLAPCKYFSALAPDRLALGAHCKLGHELDCLNCPTYEPHERPGSLESAICLFEQGKVYHIMRFAESDGYYRWGQTLCGRFVDERVYDVEIYDGETFSQSELCKKCSAESNRLSS